MLCSKISQSERRYPIINQIFCRFTSMLKTTVTSSKNNYDFFLIA
ncbi:hypothetical protein GCWU000342_00281 [Shuttleworthella satelles DSM 14600]|uniref:Uncharacterized protein n=1 Tax=Shuttleworthella satelles DSM 14600 TaxID=626523 RepID=C4G8I6_9FIRM|nr:hypothetical protein GCWU000342_00281 [Shuttleworthia satelles DSM 14600]